MKKFLTIVSVVIVLALGVFVTMNPGFLRVDNTDEPVSATPDSVQAVKIEEKPLEMRAVWISYLELDMAGTDYSERSFTEKFRTMAQTCKDAGFNTLIVQVRPFSDALYKSNIFPTSHIVAKTQGGELLYDPLKIMCEIARENKMQIHAWINPYRIAGEGLKDSLSKDNPYVENPELGIEWENGIYYDPSQKEVRMLIINGVEELLKNYDVDGIQFDDYFYPTQSEKFDESSYKAYLKSRNENNALDLTAWRKSNVSMLIADTYFTVHHTKKEAVFGVSPQGNLSNNEALYADVEAWCRYKGYLDYICPQIYFSLDNPALTFNNALKEWFNLKKHDDLKMYVGLAGYKAGSDRDDGTWLGKDNILTQEIATVRANNLPGFMLYSYQSLVDEQSEKEIQNVAKLLN